MENWRGQSVAGKDLQLENEEFCRMWGCRCYKIGYSCSWCPVLTDLKQMASAFNLKFQTNETSFEKSTTSLSHPV